MNIFKSKFFPYVAAVVLFAILTLIYFKPLLSGKELRQHDIAMHKGMSKEIVDYRERNHSEPLWTNSMFGGMPAYQISTKYPGNWLSYLDEHVFKLFLPLPAGYFFLLFLGFFILLICLEVNPWLAAAGAIAYALSSYFLSVIQAGHNSKANALGYLPALLGGIILLFRGHYRTGFAVTALFTAMELNANHVQIAYYGYMIIGFLFLGFIVDAIATKQLKQFGMAVLLFLGASLLGVLPNAGNLMTTNEYGSLSNRGKAELTINPDFSSNKNVLSGGLDKDYATNWSYGVGETFSFLIPDFKGGGNKAIMNADPDALKKVDPEMRDMVGRSDVYFGDQPSLFAPDYLGAIIIFLAVLGIVVLKNRLKWPLIAIAILAIALSWGHNFMGLTSFFMDHVPGYNKFRAVSMIMIIPELIFPLIAILTLQQIFNGVNWSDKVTIDWRFVKWELTFRKVFYGVGILVAGFCLVCYLMPETVNTFHGRNERAQMIEEYVNAGYGREEVTQRIDTLMGEIEKARIQVFRSDAMRSLIFVLLGFGLLFIYIERKITSMIATAAFAVFILADMWSVDKRYLNDHSFVPASENQQRISGMSKADEEILKDKDPDYRVLNLSVGPFDDASTSYYHKSIGGYHGAKLRRYVDLIDFHIRPEINMLYKTLSRAAANDSSINEVMKHLNVLNMLNTRYFILRAGEGEDALVPLKNPAALGNAWFVSHLVKAETPDSEIVKLKRVNTGREAVVNEKWFTQLALNSNYPEGGKIRLKSYEPNDLVYESDNSSEGFAVFSEIYYPHGWKINIDNAPVEMAQVNYVLRGVKIPAGKHTIEFRFEPSTYKVGNSIAFFGSIVLLGLVIGLLWKPFRTTLLIVNTRSEKR